MGNHKYLDSITCSCMQLNWRLRLHHSISGQGWITYVNVVYSVGNTYNVHITCSVRYTCPMSKWSFHIYQEYYVVVYVYGVQDMINNVVINVPRVSVSLGLYPGIIHARVGTDSDYNHTQTGVYIQIWPFRTCSRGWPSASVHSFTLM